MNKARRHELKMLKYKKRLRNFKMLTCQKLMEPKGEDVNGVPYNLTAFRSHGAPCSCYACQQVEHNYNRAKVNAGVKLIKNEIGL